MIDIDQGLTKTELLKALARRHQPRLDRPRVALANSREHPQPVLIQPNPTRETDAFTLSASSTA